MMKRVLIVIGCLLCTACGKPQALPHQEVLAKTTLASQKLDSAEFTLSLSGTFNAGDTNQQVEGVITSKGILQKRGTEVSQEVHAELSWGGVTLPARAGVSMRTAVSKDGSYFRIDSAELQPNTDKNIFAFLKQLEGSWWKIPASESGSIRLTPDPAVLKEQSTLLDVTEDLGIEELEDRYVYHYKVKLNPQKLQTWIAAKEPDAQLTAIQNVWADGEVWIDAKTFYLQKALWRVRGAPIDSGSINATLEIAFTNQDKAPQVEIPSAAQIFDHASLVFPNALAPNDGVMLP